MGTKPYKTKRNKRYAKRKAMKTATKIKYSGFSGSKGVLKEYSYKFQLSPQYLKNDPVTNSTLNLSGATNPVPNQSTIVTNAAGMPWFSDFGLAYSFTPRLDCVAFPDFAKLYDNYALDYISCRITYLANQAIGTLNVTPTLYYAIDQDDFDAPTNVVGVRSRQGSKMHNFGINQVCQIRIKPKLATPVYSATGEATGELALAQGGQYWQDCQSSTDVALASFFGLKLWFTDVDLRSNSTGIITCFKIEWLYNMRFKGAFTLS